MPLTRDFLVDLRGDGNLDLVVAKTTLQNTSTPLQVLLGDGRGGFTDGAHVLFGGQVPQMIAPRAHVVADFNGDGRPDIYFGDQGYDAPPFPRAFNTLVLSSGGSAPYVNDWSVPVRSDFTHTVAAADIDGDIYVGNLGSQNVAPYFLINDGVGHFPIEDRAPSVSDLSHGVVYTASTFLDVNGDGRPDLFLGGDLGARPATPPRRSCSTTAPDIFSSPPMCRSSWDGSLSMPSPWTSTATAGRTSSSLAVAEEHHPGRFVIALRAQPLARGVADHLHACALARAGTRASRRRGAPSASEEARVRPQVRRSAPRRNGPTRLVRPRRFPTGA